MSETKRRKTIDDMYGMGKLPESARPFVLAMQEMVELQARTANNENVIQNDHHFFFDGILNNVYGVYRVSIPAALFNLDEYAFTASICALIGFMGASQFGMVTHLSDTKMKGASPELVNITMMLTCIDSTWFYNMIKSKEKRAASTSGLGNWHQGSITDLAASNQSNRFMTDMLETLKKSQTLHNNIKATMTLEFLKEHYRAKVSAPKKKQINGDASIN